MFIIGIASAANDTNMLAEQSVLDDDVDDDNNKTCLDKGVAVDPKTKIPCGVNCKTGLIIPIWKGGGPGGFHYTLTDRIGRGVLYVVFMIYLFIGVSIVCDKFMDSIEMITSSEKEVSVKDPTTGETQVLVVKVWNETVANLTLMALGSSAPEIMLAVVEMFYQNFEAGDLGPGTIVGSAAFNLFMIIGICMYVIPDGEVRKIKHLRVFFITAAWSLVAYLWLYLIVGQITPGRVDVWEGVVTFLFFPLTVYMAFVADRRLYFFKYLHKKYRTGSRGVIVQTEKEDHVNINHVNEEEAVGTSVKEETNLNNLLEQRNGSIVEDGAQSTIGDTVIFKDKSNFLLGVNNWKNQFIDVLKIDSSDTDDEKVEEVKSSEKSHVLERSVSSHVWRGTGHYVYHILVFPWKLFVAFIPPTSILDGYPTFVISIFAIGLFTAVIGDVAKHLGCFLNLKDSVNAIAFVALGTSVPDTFASRSAAIHDDTADASVGNVTGSNAVNVFLGIGIAWTMAAIYHAIKGTPGGFKVPPGSLAFSITLFCIEAFIAIAILLLRRHPRVGGELGGPKILKTLSFGIFIFLWLFYVLISSLEAYGVISSTL